jgi:hypothetical protein
VLIILSEIPRSLNCFSDAVFGLKENNVFDIDLSLTDGINK